MKFFILYTRVIESFDDKYRENRNQNNRRVILQTDLLENFRTIDEKRRRFLVSRYLNPKY